MDKKKSCKVWLSGAGVTINDVGGVGTTIEWTVLATDGSGNSFSTLCSTTVQNPGKGNGGGSSCNNGKGNGDEGCSPGKSGGKGKK